MGSIGIGRHGYYRYSAHTIGTVYVCIQHATIGTPGVGNERYYRHSRYSTYTTYLLKASDILQVMSYPQRVVAITLNTYCR